MTDRLDRVHGISRRAFTGGLAGAAMAPLAAKRASAQAYPVRLVKWVVPYPPGGATDVSARLIGQRLSQRLGQAFIIENKPGAGANLGTEAVVNAPPDGYTLLFVSTANAINAPQESAFQLHSRYRTGLRDRAAADRVGGQSVGPGKNGAGTYFLRQGQSWQGDLCVRGDRHVPAPHRGDVQVDGWH